MTAVQQLDLFADIDAEDRAIRAAAEASDAWKREITGAALQPLLGDEHRPAAWLRARQAWTGEHGHFGSGFRCHAWTIAVTHPGADADPEALDERLGGPCAPTVMHLDLRCHDWTHTHLVRASAAMRGEEHLWHTPRGCLCVGDMLCRGYCLGCGWLGPIHQDFERPGVEDAIRHVWPDVDERPLVNRVPMHEGSGASKAARRALQAWIDKVTAVYPPGWLEGGGPIRTPRDTAGARHVPFATPWGGYDLGVTVDGTEARA